MSRKHFLCEILNLDEDTMCDLDARLYLLIKKTSNVQNYTVVCLQVQKPTINYQGFN